MKCDACGSTDIDVDVSRADAVCTGCGNVLESSFIVSDIQVRFVIVNVCTRIFVGKYLVSNP